MRSLRLPTTMLAACVLGVLPACGGDDSGGGGTAFPRAEADVVVTAVDIAFREASYEADAGEIKVFYVNEGAAAHTLLVEDAAGETVAGFKLEVPSNGDEDAGTVTLEAGDYVFYCDIPGHRSAGMEAPLTVS